LLQQFSNLIDRLLPHSWCLRGWVRGSRSRHGCTNGCRISLRDRRSRQDYGLSPNSLKCAV
jgi:hypothetical protein